MNTVADHIRAGYSVVSSHGGDVVGHYLVLQKDASVVLAKLPTSAWTGEPKKMSGKTEFIEVSK